MSLTNPLFAAHETFILSEQCADLEKVDADIAFVGIPFRQSYSFAETPSEASLMPRAMREASLDIVYALDHYDFDLGDPLYDQKPIRAADCGDVVADPLNPTSHYANAEAAVRRIIASGAMPIIFGGDHGVPIPVSRALDSLGPITVIHVDQPINRRNEVNGVREGLSSPIRRASEMDSIRDIFQIGPNGIGSTRPEEIEAATACGSNLITAEEVHDDGMESVLARIPYGGNCYITLDLDGMNGGVAPCPSGLHFHQVRKLIHGPVGKARVVGMDVVEIVPLAGRQSDYLHYRRPPPRQPYRHRHPSRLLQESRQSIAQTPPRQRFCCATQTFGLSSFDRPAAVYAGSRLRVQYNLEEL